jgi:hypothetical protein
VALPRFILGTYLMFLVKNVVSYVYINPRVFSTIPSIKLVSLAHNSSLFDSATADI